jgi:hypothetical protein
MRQFVGVVALVVLALMAVPPAGASDKGKKKSQAKLMDISWGRRSDIVSRYWPPRQHPNVRIF